MPTAPSDFRLYHGNDLDMLAAVLASELKKTVAGTPLLAPDTILIPQPAMRRWLQKTLAETHGIAANLRFLTPGEFVRVALDANLPDAGDAAVGDAATLRWRLWSQLADTRAAREPVFAPLRALLDVGDRTLAAWTLAGELAAAFEKYQAWRRDWLRRWDQGADRDDWQAELWRRATRGLSHRGARLDAYLSRFGESGNDAPAGLPARVFAFGCQNVSPDVLRVIASAARAGALHFFFLSPVRGWWGDLRTAAERLRDAPAAVFDDEENPLLRANGATGRDFVRTLFSYDVVHPDWELALYEPPDPATKTGLLHRLQRDLLERRPLPEPGAALPTFAVPDIVKRSRRDRSLQVHACHTRLREVQVLHDQLRDLLEHDPSLQPRDIAVLTPDVDAYAAAVRAVFGAAGSDGRASTSLSTNASRFIPYAITDGSALAGQPLVDAFLRLLALPTARFTVNEVLELLCLPAIAERFGLRDADFDRLREPLRAAGARWGLDARHRSALAAPTESAYTWAWALDRLLLGHASGDDADIAGVAPLPIIEGDALTRLDVLLQGLRALARLQNVFGRTQTAGQWRTRLAQALDDLLPVHLSDPDDQRAREWLQMQIARFGEQTATAALDGELPPEIVRAWFQSAFNEDDTRQPFLTGGVTIARMVPLRLIPFRVICLLGMNDGDYPRRDPIGSLNRLSAELPSPARRIGDRSIRDDDRGLFLQLFAAASDCFYLSYLGADPRSGEILPPSVLVAELLDVVGRCFDNPDDALEHFTVRHSLQPFSADAFGRGDARRLSYHGAWRPAAETRDAARSSLPVFARDLPVRDELPPESLIVRDDLYRTLAHPSKSFLRQRLGLRLAEIGERLPETEPFDGNDGLRRHGLHERVFSALTGATGMDRPRLHKRLLAEGWIAPGAGGGQEADAVIDELSVVAQQWHYHARGVAGTRPFELPLGESTLVGTLTSVHDSGLLQFRAGKAHGKAQLALGIDALIWSALGETQPVYRFLAGQPPQRIAALAKADACAALSALIELMRQARRQSLPLMPKTGFAYCRMLADSSSDIAAWKSAAKEWKFRDADGDERGEGRDAWVRLALRGDDPFDDPDGATAQEFRRLSRALFDPLLAMTAQAGSP
jgi:exodeoxyribonuclease V gamma subunit